jgi:hypothetical protein
MDHRSNRPVPRWVIYALIASYLSGIVVTVSTFIYANYVDNKSNHAWCSVIITLDDTYIKTPPTTDAGRNVALNIHNLRRTFEC